MKRFLLVFWLFAFACVLSFEYGAAVVPLGGFCQQRACTTLLPTVEAEPEDENETVSARRFYVHLKIRESEEALFTRRNLPPQSSFVPPLTLSQRTRT